MKRTWLLTELDADRRAWTTTPQTSPRRYRRTRYPVRRHHAEVPSERERVVIRHGFAEYKRFGRPAAARCFPHEVAAASTLALDARASVSSLPQVVEVP
jgi:hypothetical protein